jgi:hypothetical protein
MINLLLTLLVLHDIFFGFVKIFATIIFMDFGQGALQNTFMKSVPKSDILHFSDL